MGLARDDDPVEVRVRAFRASDGERWDAFVRAHPDGSFFHLSGWARVIEEGLGHKAHYLLAERDGEIRGVLPLGRVRSRLFGDALSSTPFCVYGGAVAADDTARETLERAACDLARELRVDYLELRNRERRHHDWPAKDLYVTFVKEIDPDPERNLLAIPRKQRAMVRKGIEAGLRGDIDDDLDRFFDVYSASVHRLGTPVFPPRYFRALRQVFGEQCELLTVFDRDGAAVSSVMSFYFRDQVLPYYGGSLAEARNLKANDFMYWDLMRRACERGIRVFDYGRSKVGTGSYHFKLHWGFEPTPLAYEYCLVRAGSVPDINPLNPKYRMFIALWQRMPLALSRRIGPLIARNLG